MTTSLAVTSAGWTRPWVEHVFVFLMESESQVGQAQLLLNPEPLGFSSWGQTDQRNVEECSLGIIQNETIWLVLFSLCSSPSVHLLYIISMWCLQETVAKSKGKNQKLDLRGAPECMEQFRFSWSFIGKHRKIKLGCDKRIKAETRRDK